MTSKVVVQCKFCPGLFRSESQLLEHVLKFHKISELKYRMMQDKPAEESENTYRNIQENKCKTNLYSNIEQHMSKLKNEANVSPKNCKNISINSEAKTLKRSLTVSTSSIGSFESLITKNQSVSISNQASSGYESGSSAGKGETKSKILQQLPNKDTIHQAKRPCIENPVKISLKCLDSPNVTKHTRRKYIKTSSEKPEEQTGSKMIFRQNWMFESPELSDIVISPTSSQKMMLISPCLLCNEDFKNTNVFFLNEHMMTCHDINILQYFKLFFDTGVQWYEACLYKCHICENFTSTSLSKLKDHLGNSHPKALNSSNIEPNGKSYIKCPLCTEIQVHSTSLLKHCEKEHDFISTQMLFAKIVQQLKDQNKKKDRKNFEKNTYQEEMNRKPSDIERCFSAHSSENVFLHAQNPSASIQRYSNDKSDNENAAIGTKRSNIVKPSLQTPSPSKSNEGTGKEEKINKSNFERNNLNPSIGQDQPTINQNMTKCLSNSSSKANKQKDTVEKMNNSTNVSSNPSTDAIEKKLSPKSLGQTKRKSLELILNQCAYTCLICDFLTRSKHEFQKHLDSEHRASIQEYMKTYGSPRTQTAHMKCRLCLKKIIYDMVSIEFHLKNKHRTTIDDYMKLLKTLRNPLV